MDTIQSSDPSTTFTAAMPRRAAFGRLVGSGLVAALLAAAGRAHAQAQATPSPRLEEGTEPNHFMVRVGEVQIVYDTTGFAGEPQLTYRGPIGSGPIEERPFDSRTVVGDQIRTEQFALGRLVTVYLDAMPDAATFFLTLLLPEFNPMILGADPTPFATLAILTTRRTSIAGPGLIEGALQEYVAVALEGTAEFVAS